MPCVAGAIDSPGAIFSVVVKVSGPRERELKSVGAAVPQPLILKGMIDTGASCSCVDPNSILALGLLPRARVVCVTPSTDENGTTVDQYEIGVALASISTQGQGFVSFPSILAVGANLSHQGFDILIGRDILSHCLLVYDGRRNQFTLAY